MRVISCSFLKGKPRATWNEMRREELWFKFGGPLADLLGVLVKTPLPRPHPLLQQYGWLHRCGTHSVSGSQKSLAGGLLWQWHFFCRFFWVVNAFFHNSCITYVKPFILIATDIWRSPWAPGLLVLGLLLHSKHTEMYLHLTLPRIFHTTLKCFVLLE